MNLQRILLNYVLIVCAANATAAVEIEHFTTPNGAQVYFVEAPEIAMVDVRVVFNAGSAQDGELAGTALFTNALLSEGAGALEANEFNDKIADTGAEFSSGALRDMAWVSLRSMSAPRYLEPALALMQLALSEPRFDASAIQRIRANTLVRIKHEKQSPSALANLAFYRAVYGEHPYARPMHGTEQSVGEIKREDLVSFYERHYVANNATIAIVGALSRDAAEALATKLSAGLTAGSAAAKAGAVPPLNEAIEQHVEFPSIQSHVRIGQPGMKRGDPDYFPLLVGNHVLGGGGLVSILADEVREKRGLSYSVNSHFSPMAARGPFVASLQTDNSQQDEAVQVLREQLSAFIANGPSPERLEAAKQNLMGGFPLRIDSNAKIVEYLSMIGFYELPLDYLETFPAKVAAITAENVRAAFKRLDPNKMVTIIVGKKASDES